VSGWQLTLIVLGIVLLGIGVLIAALMTLPGRARLLKRALRRLSWRAEEAQSLQVKALALQAKAATLQAGLAETQAKSAAIQAGRRTVADPSATDVGPGRRLLD
jgi:Zn-dependent membrane protease YugP